MLTRATKRPTQPPPLAASLLPAPVLSAYSYRKHARQDCGSSVTAQLCFSSLCTLVADKIVSCFHPCLLAPRLFPQHVTDWAEEFDDEDSFQINETKTPVSVRTAAIRRSFLPIEKRKAARTRTLQRVHTHFAVMVGGGGGKKGTNLLSLRS